MNRRERWLVWFITRLVAVGGEPVRRRVMWEWEDIRFPLPDTPPEEIGTVRMVGGPWDGKDMRFAGWHRWLTILAQTQDGAPCQVVYDRAFSLDPEHQMAFYAGVFGPTFPQEFWPRGQDS